MTTLVDRQRLKVVFILVPLIVITFVTGDCELNINQNISNEPILLNVSRRSYELIHFKKCQLQLNTTQNILLACPGKQNYLIATNNPWNFAKCHPTNNLEINKRIIQFSELKCNRKPKAKFKISGRKCFKNNGVIIGIGFEVLKTWHPLLTVCYNRQKHLTYYVEHSLIIPNSPCNKTNTTRPNFIEGGSLYSDVEMAKIYTIKNQYKLFKNLTGANASNYINRRENKFLARGQLAPYADFPINAWKSLTFFYMNAAPQWQSINAGQWSSLETNIRILSRKMKQLKVYTGTHGVMKIGKKGLYLFKNKVPVPEYLWKLVYNPEDYSCMGFINKNNPFLKQQPRSICNNVCTSFNWNMETGNLFNGIVHCCEYYQLAKVIEEVPSSIKCKRALRFE